TRSAASGNGAHAGSARRVSRSEGDDHRHIVGASQRDRRASAGTADRSGFGTVVGAAQFSGAHRRHGDAFAFESTEGFTMKPKTMIIALAAAGVVAIAGYGLFRAGMEQGMKMSGSSPGGTAAPTAGAQKPGDVDPTTGKK